MSFVAINDDSANVHSNGLVLSEREQLEVSMRIRLDQTECKELPERISMLDELCSDLAAHCTGAEPRHPLLELKRNAVHRALDCTLRANVLDLQVSSDGSVSGLRSQEMTPVADKCVALYRSLLQISRTLLSSSEPLKLDEVLICRLAKLCYEVGYGRWVIELFELGAIPVEHWLYAQMLEYALPFLALSSELDKVSRLVVDCDSSRSPIVSMYANPHSNQDYLRNMLNVSRRKRNLDGCFLKCLDERRRSVDSIDEKTSLSIAKCLLRQIAALDKCPHVLVSARGTICVEQAKGEQQTVGPKSPPDECCVEKRRSCRGIMAASSWVSKLITNIGVHLIPVSRDLRECPFRRSGTVDEDVDSPLDEEKVSEDFCAALAESQAYVPFMESIKIFVELLSTERNTRCVSWTNDLRMAFLQLCNSLFEGKYIGLSAEAYVTYVEIVMSQSSSIKSITSPFFYYALTKISEAPETDRISLVLAYFLYNLDPVANLDDVCVRLCSITDPDFVLKNAPPMSASHLSRLVNYDVSLRQARIIPSAKTLTAFLNIEPETIPSDIIAKIIELKDAELLCMLVQITKTVSPNLIRELIRVEDDHVHSFCILSRLISMIDSNFPSALLDSDDFWILFMVNYERLCVAQKPDMAERLFCRMFGVIHDALGQNATCTLSDNGKFLKFVIGKLFEFLKLDESNTNSFCLQCIQQAIHCVWDICPISNKQKVRYIVEHCRNTQPLTPEDCFLVYSSWEPDGIPSPPDYKTLTMGECEEHNPSYEKIAKVLNLETPNSFEYNSLVSGFRSTQTKTEAIFKQLTEDQCELPPQTEPFRNIFYLTAHSFMESQRFNEAIRYFFKDVWINPKRFESWSGLIMCLFLKVEQLLLDEEEDDSTCSALEPSSSPTTPSVYLAKLKPTLCMFEKAYDISIALQPEQPQMSIQYASDPQPRFKISKFSVKKLDSHNQCLE